MKRDGLRSTHGDENERWGRDRLKTKDFQAGHNGMGDSVVVTKIGQKKRTFFA